MPLKFVDGMIREIAGHRSGLLQIAFGFLVACLLGSGSAQAQIFATCTLHGNVGDPFKRDLSVDCGEVPSTQCSLLEGSIPFAPGINTSVGQGTAV
jgi:hypothetical protein